MTYAMLADISYLLGEVVKEADYTKIESAISYSRPPLSKYTYPPHIGNIIF